MISVYKYGKTLISSVYFYYMVVHMVYICLVLQSVSQHYNTILSADIQSDKQGVRGIHTDRWIDIHTDIH